LGLKGSNPSRRVIFFV